MPGLRDLIEEALSISRDPGKLADLINTSTTILEIDGSVFKVHRPGVVEFLEAPSISFIGDIHGDFYSLIAVLENVFPRIIDNGVAVFLGDYIDRGYLQVESITLLLLLKKLYPDKVVLLRGNHEPPEFLKPYPHDFPDILNKYFGGEGHALYRLFLKLFSKLPLIAFRRRGFIAVHGGPPLRCIRSTVIEDAFEIGSQAFSAETIESVLWSDPVELGIDVIPSPRGAGYLYGSRFTEKALSLIGDGVIIRSHEYVDGYREAHNGRVITVFSAPLVYELRYAGVLVYSETEGRSRLERILVEPVQPGRY